MKLTIIIPVYNVEAYIRRCLNSVCKLSSLVGEYEILVVNDGTPDQSMDIVEEYTYRYPYIRIINQENRGLGAARNVALYEAQGEYVYFLDSDDSILEYGFVHLFTNGILRRPDIIVGNYVYIDQHGVECSPKHLIKGVSELYLDGETYFNRYYVKYTNILVVQGIYRKDFLLKNRLEFTEKIYFEDVNWMPKVLVKASNIYFRSISFYNYYLREGSIINSDYTPRKFHDILFISEDLLEFSDSCENHITRKNIAYLAIVGLCVSIGRYLACHSLSFEDEMKIKKILNRKVLYFFYLKFFVKVYLSFFSLVNYLLKVRYRNLK